MTATDPTRLELLHPLATADVAVRRDLAYPTAHGSLAFDLYAPPRATHPLPAVVVVSGYPDAGLAAFAGRPLRTWASYTGWARAMAASGMAAVLYENREPADAHALVAHLRADAAALGLDPARLAVWACSGHVPQALDVIARARPACAALLYGYLLDLDGATEVADAAAKFRFAAPPVALDDLRATPTLVVRAGKDAMPGLDTALVRSVAAARACGVPVDVDLLPDAPHAFDLVDDTPASRAAIERVLAFLARHLA